MNTLSLIRWAGGKGKQLKDLLPLIPQTRIYCEPCGGGASVLLNKERSEVECYNDLDGALVNLFEVLRGSETAAEFMRLVDLMPYSRAEFERAFSFEGIEDPVYRAVAFYTFMGLGFSGKRLAIKSEWSRARSDNLAQRWFDKHQSLPYIHERVKGIQIECRDALDVIQEWDTDETTFYIDPPYILDTRKKQKYYAVEPGDEWHKEMVDVLLRVRGNVVLSGYDHPIYHELVDRGGWWSDKYGAKAIMAATVEGGAKAKRVEVVYRNPQACELGVRRPLFEAGEFGAVEREQTRGQYET